MTICRSRIAILLLALLAGRAYAVDRALILAASDSVIDIERDLGMISIGNLSMAGTDATTTGELIVIRGGIMATNNAAVTIGALHCDATIFNKGRKFRLVKMVDTTARDLFLTINGGQFAYGDAINFTNPTVTHPLGLGEQWYNSDSSNIISRLAAGCKERNWPPRKGRGARAIALKRCLAK